MSYLIHGFGTAASLGTAAWIMHTIYTAVPSVALNPILTALGG